MSTSEPKKQAPPDEAPSQPEPEQTAAKSDDTGAGASAAESGPDQPASGEPTATGEAAAKAETAKADEAEAKARAEEPVWPPPESQPTTEGDKPEPALLTKNDGAQAGDAKSSDAKPSDAKSPDLASGADDAAKPTEGAAEPGQEMALSESTLHWLVDGELPVEPTGPQLAPIYDSRAPVVGRKRTFAILGGAAVLALGVALLLHAQAASSEKATAPAANVGSADLLIHRAEAALAQGRPVEALDLARLATVTDPHYADAYVVMAGIQASNGQTIDARDSYRRYLELAPLGSHSAEARAALASLPP